MRSADDLPREEVRKEELGEDEVKERYVWCTTEGNIQPLPHTDTRKDSSPSLLCTPLHSLGWREEEEKVGSNTILKRGKRGNGRKKKKVAWMGEKKK